MTLRSIIQKRLADWVFACDAHDYELVPPLSAELLAARAPNEVALRAVKSPDLREHDVTLTVQETWREGPDPDGDRHLESDGCHLIALRWHVQIGNEIGALGAERLDVVPGDSDHPRIHRHPLGEPNEVRMPAELSPPGAWLYTVDTLIAERPRGAASD